MKKIIAIAALVLVSAAALAQNTTKDIYSKYSGKDGVSSVYISPMMFKLIKTLPDMNVSGETVNLTKIIKDLQGLFILNTGRDNLRKNLAEDVEKYLKAGKLELLLEANDGGDNTRIYVSEKDGMVSDLILYTKEPGEVSMISVCGQMKMDDLAALLELENK